MSETSLFNQIKAFKHPATILWRSIEIKLLKQLLNIDLSSTNKVIVDLGCGEGIITGIIFGKKISFGVDNDRKMIEKAKNSGLYDKALYCDASKSIPLPPNSVDLVFSNSVIEHIPNIDGVLKEVRKVLKTGGQFVFTVPNNNLSDWSIVTKFFSFPVGHLYGIWRNKKFNHHHLYTLDHWNQLLSNYGFKLQKSYTYLDKPTIELWDKLLWTGRIPYIIDKKTLSIIFTIYSKSKKIKNGAATTILAVKL
jgi:SAM-dependent methyltransferase